MVILVVRVVCDSGNRELRNGGDPSNPCFAGDYVAFCDVKLISDQATVHVIYGLALNVYRFPIETEKLSEKANEKTASFRGELSDLIFHDDADKVFKRAECI